MMERKADVKLIPATKIKAIKRVAIYARVSTAGRAQLKSLVNQVSGLTRLIYILDSFILKNVYMEVVSGKAGSARPELSRLLEDCRNHEIDYIFVKNVDRLGRDTSEVLEVVRKVRKYGVEIYFEGGNIDTATESYELEITLAAALAQAENENRSANIRQGMIYHAEEGTSGFYKRKCYGYSKDEEGNLIIDEKQSKIVKYIFRLCVEGKSVQKIREILYEEKLPTPSGEIKLWPKKTITDILSNRKYVGKSVIKPCRVPGNKSMLLGAFPAILTEDEFNEAQSALEKRRKGKIGIDYPS